MDELLKALPSLLGVVVGGLITFFIQNRTIRKQQKWEREKMSGLRGKTMKQGKDMRSKNDIFHDYLKRLERIEASDQSYQWPPIRRWTSSSW